MAFDENPDEVFENEPDAETEGNGDEQSNRSFRMMMIGLFAFGGLGVLLIALLLIGRSGDRTRIDAENQAVQATNAEVIRLSQITPTPLPTDTPRPTNTAAPTGTPAPTATPKPKDLVDTALGASDLSTLATLLKTAALEDVLKGQGPFTIFAPTNDAFAQLSPETLAALDKDPTKLAELLKYHVVNGAIKVDDAAKMNGVTTLEGKPITITVTDGKVQINDANVTKPDQQTANGVIHTIDKVLVPPELSKEVVLAATPKPGTVKTTAVAQVQPTKSAAGAQATAVVPTKVPPQSATATAAASKVTNTGTVTGTNGTTDKNLPKTGANDNLFLLVLAAIGLVGVLVAARRLRTSQG
jgi:LPXTG-motif cell wall-anchored protein